MDRRRHNGVQLVSMRKRLQTSRRSSATTCTSFGVEWNPAATFRRRGRWCRFLRRTGGMRILGVPTVADRVAQTVVKQILEPILEPVFDDNSYGYRPGRSAHDAIAVVRGGVGSTTGSSSSTSRDCSITSTTTCCCEPCVSTVEWKDGCGRPWNPRTEMGVGRDRGTPQGGVVSPLLANLFLHYAIDAWMRREMRSVRLCRDADDGVIHCRSQAQARLALDRICSTVAGLWARTASREDANCLLQGR